jgi:ATP-dependent RNA helicase RhlE
VGRTARAEATGDAFTFAAPDEASDLAAIERAIGKPLPRITLPGFDYAKRAAERFEVPIAERIAQIRARKSEERARAREKAERRAAAGVQRAAAPARPAPAPSNVVSLPRPSARRRRRRFSGPRTGTNGV